MIWEVIPPLLCFGTYALFEFATAGVVWRWVDRFELKMGERVAAWLAVQMALLAFLSFSFHGRPAPFFYAVMLLGARTQMPRPSVPFLPASWPWLAALVPMLAVFLRPVREPDSLFNLHFLLNWVDQGKSPYDFAFHYVSFWELSYTPAITVPGTDLLLWVPSLKAIVLLGVLLWLIADEFGLAAWLKVAALGNGLLFVHLWHGPSGLATIKNDMIAAAGQAALALAVLRLARGQLARFEQGLLIGGAVFVCTKFSGPVLLVLVLPLVAWQLRGRLKGEWRWLLNGAIVWMVTVGHYYVRNAWVYGNPVYPFSVNLGPLRLPGLGDLSHTSILYSLQNPEVWHRFFMPEGGLSPLGVLFPLALAVLPLALWRARRPYALFTLACLLVYVRSVFSASGQPGDLQFVKNDLNSFRYVEGAWLAAELFLVSLLARWPGLAWGAVAVSGASRLWILGVRARMEVPPDWPLWAAGVLLACGAVVWAWRAPRRLGWAMALFLPAGALMVESRRDGGLPQWEPLLAAVGEPWQPVYLVVDDEYSEQACAHLPLKGRWLDRKVTTGPLAQSKGEDYVVWVRRPGQSEPVLPAYRVKVQTAAGTVFARNRD